MNAPKPTLNSFELVLLAKPYLLRLDTSNEALYALFSSFQYGSFFCTFFARIALETALACDGKPQTDGMYVDITNNVKQALTSVAKSMMERKSPLSVIHPAPLVLSNIMNPQLGQTSLGYCESYAAHNLAKTGDRDKFRLLRPIDAFDDFLLFSDDDLSRSCRMAVLANDSFLPVIENVMKELLEAWVSSEIEASQTFPDFAAMIGDLFSKARSDYCADTPFNKYMHKYLYEDTLTAAERFDLCQQQSPSVPFSQFTQLFIMSTVGELPESYAKQVIEALDYQLFLSLAGF